MFGCACHKDPTDSAGEGGGFRRLDAQCDAQMTWRDKDAALSQGEARQGKTGRCGDGVIVPRPKRLGVHGPTKSPDRWHFYVSCLGRCNTKGRANQ